MSVSTPILTAGCARAIAGSDSAMATIAAMVRSLMGPFSLMLG